MAGVEGPIGYLPPDEALDKPSHIVVREPGEPIEPLVHRTKYDHSKKQKIVEYLGKRSVRITHRPIPIVTDPGDIILKVTSTCICGSDLHLYEGAISGMRPGDTLGHECMGEVVDVGPEVKGIKKGDRAISSFDLGCGQCFYCKRELYSCCEATNPTGGLAEEMWGHHTGGWHGYTHLTGGYDGVQAQYARVPIANVNALKVPPHMTDEQVVLLSDIFPTAWHCNELAQVGKGDIVAVWGCGPVGTLAALCAKHRGASRVIVIDQYDYRLENARKRIPGVETINFREHWDVPKRLKELVPTGPDCGLECVGVHYAKSQLHKTEMALKLETDPSDMVNEMVMGVRKGGRIGIIGAYGAYTNHFNIGAFMEKGMSMAAGQCPVQKYWKMLLQKIVDKQMDPTIAITHEPSLDHAAKMYKTFNNKEDNCIKVVMKPQAPL